MKLSQAEIEVVKKNRETYNDLLNKFCEENDCNPIMSIVVSLNDGGYGLFTRQEDMPLVVATLREIANKIERKQPDFIKMYNNKKHD